MSSWNPFEMEVQSREHRKALVHQGAQSRLARLARDARPKNKRYNAVLSGLGTRLVGLGKHLQTRYGEPAKPTVCAHIVAPDVR